MASQRSILLFTLLFLLAPLFYKPNLGGIGLDLTFNIMVWATAILLISFGAYQIVSRHEIFYPNNLVLWLAFPLFIILSSLFKDINQPDIWLFRVLFIFGGYAFLITLMQFKLKPIIQERILLIIAVSAFFQALIGLCQIYFEDLPYYSVADHVPRGVFQQVNVLGTFLVTGILISLYLISRPSYIFKPVCIKIIYILIIAVMLHIIVASGSRVSLLSLVVAIPVLLYSRYTYLLSQKKYLALLIVVSIFAFLSAQSGFEQTVVKTVKLVEEDKANARVSIFSIAISLINQQPLLGFGIGDFLKEWNLASSDFYQNNKDAYLPSFTTHPHNELLFWAIEGGFLALSGLMMIALAIVKEARRLGMRGIAYVALLLPITIHTQVELPFYISSLHWFTFIFLLYLLLSHRLKVVETLFSPSLEKLISFGCILLPILSSLFLIDVARAQKDIYNFVKDIESDTPPLSIALSNLYTKNYAEQLAMRSMLYNAIEQHDKEKVQLFENWAMDFVIKSPELKMYEDLISASVFLRPQGKGCDAIKAGLAMYAQNKPLQIALEKCD